VDDGDSSVVVLEGSWYFETDALDTNSIGSYKGVTNFFQGFMSYFGYSNVDGGSSAWSFLLPFIADY
jgi:hypothetical protein